MKVFVFTPTWIKDGDGTLAMRPETQASVEAQEFDGEIVHEIGTFNPFGDRSHRNVLAQYQRARRMFLESDADAFMTFEHDMTMPADAVQKLSDELRRGAGVAYGVYMLRHGSLVLNTWEYIGDHALGESLSVHPKKLAAARKARVVRVCGCGWGCTMFRRDVVEQIEFHDGGGQNPAGDLAMAHDALFRGIRSVAVMDVACDHYDGELRLRPYGETMADSVKVIAMQDVVVLDGMGTRKLQRGETYEIGRVLASDLMRAGYVRPLEVENSAVDVENSAAGKRNGDGMTDLSREPETAAIEPNERTVMKKGRRKRVGL